MTREEFEQFLTRKEIYAENSSTQSSDEGVLQIYSYILEYENTDSDWWNEDHGTTDIMYMIKNGNQDIFEKIKEDISNWTGSQIELFAQTLVSNNLRDFKINERMQLYLELFDIPKSDCDLYTVFYDRSYLDLELADQELLVKLAKRLNFSSVEQLMKNH
ncbi:hypothetical protein CLU96_2090 [Chryseobacterium sp. 52]|uniref:hypothetical protein n=1 Tax=Chryseobacterium sp. 52 TaxID=2035213 RepID=UPI000C19B80F|nr:hypothetical protein [Chryseobacterium sp. 52]PIF45090.1 hypothetical protein CLU96_2090 [Chryseobacterium sp. 52]